MSWARGFAEHGYDPEPRPRPDWVADEPSTVTREAADLRAWRAFWRGVVTGGLMVGASFLAGAAWSETIAIGGVIGNGSAMVGTTVSIEPSAVPGELAVVTLVNEHVNDAGDDAEYFIGLPGLAVGVTFTWDATALTGADRITVRPPEGITCRPRDCSVTVMEGFTGQVVLLDWVGM